MGYVELPEDADSSILESDEFLGRFHHALLELHLEEGALVCPETGRRFPVNKGIPNMLLHEDEAVIWLSDVDKSKGYAVDFLSISLHAVSRDPEAYPIPCLYTQIETDADEDDSNTLIQNAMITKIYPRSER